MDTFLVIAGILFVVFIVAILIINKLNINIKIKGVNLKYWLTGGAIIVGIITLIVLKCVLGKKSRVIDELLTKLRKTKADADLKVIDEKMNNNQEKVDNIDGEIEVLKEDYDKNSNKIEKLQSTKLSIDKQIANLNENHNKKIKDKTTLDDAISRMKNRLN